MTVDIQERNLGNQVEVPQNRIQEIPDRPALPDFTMEIFKIPEPGPGLQVEVDQHQALLLDRLNTLRRIQKKLIHKEEPATEVPVVENRAPDESKPLSGKELDDKLKKDQEKIDNLIKIDQSLRTEDPWGKEDVPPERLDDELRAVEDYADRKAAYEKEREIMIAETEALLKAKAQELVSYMEQSGYQKYLSTGAAHYIGEDVEKFKEHRTPGYMRVIAQDLTAEARRNEQKPALKKFFSKEQNEFFKNAARLCQEFQAVDELDEKTVFLNKPPYIYQKYPPLERSVAKWATDLTRKDGNLDLYEQTAHFFWATGRAEFHHSVQTQYNQWVNGKVLDLCYGNEGLSDKDRADLADWSVLNLTGDPTANMTIFYADELLCHEGVKEWHKRYFPIVRKYLDIIGDYQFDTREEGSIDYFLKGHESQAIYLSTGEIKEPTAQKPIASPLFVKYFLELPGTELIKDKILHMADAQKQETRNALSDLARGGQIDSYKLSQYLAVLKYSDKPDPVSFVQVLKLLGSFGFESGTAREDVLQTALVCIRNFDQNPDLLKISEEELTGLSPEQIEGYKNLQEGKYNFFMGILAKYANPRRLLAESKAHYHGSRQEAERLAIFKFVDHELMEKLNSDFYYERDEVYWKLAKDSAFDTLLLETLLEHEASLPDADPHTIDRLLSHVMDNFERGDRITKAYPPRIIDILINHNRIPEEQKNIIQALREVSEGLAINYFSVINRNPEQAVELRNRFDSYLQKLSRSDSPYAHHFKDEEMLDWMIKNPDKILEISQVFNGYGARKEAPQATQIIKFLKYSGAEGFLNSQVVESYLKILAEYPPEDVFEMVRRYRVDKSLNPYSPNDLETLKEFANNYGPLYIPELWKLYKDLLVNIPPTPQMVEVGITHTGKEGLQELMQSYKNIAKEVIEERNINLDVRNPVVEDLVAVVTRYRSSQWARKDQAFRKLIEGLQQDVKSGVIAPVPPEYTPAKIAVKELKEATDFKFTEPALNKFNLYRKDLHAAVKIVEEKNDEQTTQRLVDSVQRSVLSWQKRIQDQMESLDERLNSQGVTDEKRREAARRGLTQQQRNVEGLATRVGAITSSRQFISELSELGSTFNDKEASAVVASSLRQLLFARAIQINQDYAVDPYNVPQSIVRLDELNLQAVARLMETVQNGVKFETLPTLELSKEQDRFLRKSVVDMTVFEEELKRAQEVAEGQFEEFQAYPDRGILTELSGYYSDACWTRETNIVRNNPNMVGFAYVKDVKGVPTIMGGCLLIETKLSNGEPAVVIRGINPRENVIRRLQGQDFFEKNVAMIQDWAEKRGIKHIVAPAGSSGALSNRPTINTYVSSTYTQKVGLGETVNFNGYDITNNCFLIKTIE